jgi:hypothetical protein
MAHTLDQCCLASPSYSSDASRLFRCYDKDIHFDGIMNQPSAMLLFDLRNNKCSVARDRVFSLASICSEKGLIQVDYEFLVFQFVYQILSVFNINVCVCTTTNILRILRLEID